MELVAVAAEQDTMEDVLRVVGGGKKVLILRDGRHVATVSPAQMSKSDVHEIMERVRVLREKIRARSGTFTMEEINDLRREGRR